MTQTCFVIQPFDKGKFDKRYKEVFKPAIEAAGLEAYRVDQDPAVSIPIDEIEKGIRSAAICLVDVTLDNPNVWFELGYALACKKEICIVCSVERQGKYPFDIQHRSIIRYSSESPGDFQNLSEQITDRIKAALKKRTTLSELVDQSPVADVQGLSNHEMVALCAVMQDRTGSDSVSSTWSISRDMERSGFTGLAASLAFEKLKRKGLLKAELGFEYNGEQFEGLQITAEGIDWLLKNENELNLVNSSRAKRSGFSQDLDDEIPF